MTRLFKLEIYVPVSHAAAVRLAIGNAGAGVFGNYRDCSFSTIGTGRFRGDEHTHPTIGIAENNETVQEEKIETQVRQEYLEPVLDALKKAHPYEEMVFQIIELVDVENLSAKN